MDMFVPQSSSFLLLFVNPTYHEMILNKYDVLTHSNEIHDLMEEYNFMHTEILCSTLRSILYSINHNWHILLLFFSYQITKE